MFSSRAHTRLRATGALLCTDMASAAWFLPESLFSPGKGRVTVRHCAVDALGVGRPDKLVAATTQPMSDFSIMSLGSDNVEDVWKHVLSVCPKTAIESMPCVNKEMQAVITAAVKAKRHHLGDDWWRSPPLQPNLSMAESATLDAQLQQEWRDWLQVSGAAASWVGPLFAEDQARVLGLAHDGWLTGVAIDEFLAAEVCLNDGQNSVAAAGLAVHSHARRLDRSRRA